MAFMPIYIVRTPWEKAVWLYAASEQKVGWVMEWNGHPLDCYDYWSTCGANSAVLITALVFHEVGETTNRPTRSPRLTLLVSVSDNMELSDTNRQTCPPKMG